MRKVKVTYQSGAAMYAKILSMDNWYNLISGLGSYGIFEGDVLKMEVVIEAPNENIEDLTQD